MTLHHVEDLLPSIQRQKDHLLHKKVKEEVRARQKPSLNPRLRHRHMSLQLNLLVQMQHGHWKKMLDMEMFTRS